jgi:hypothetical protein
MSRGRGVPEQRTLEALLREIFPIEARTTRRCASSTWATSSVPPAALHARRVPQAALETYGYPRYTPVQGAAAPGQAGARRGGGLPRRDPDHDRRRRVHHQRRRARHRQPAPPLAGRRLLVDVHAGEKKLHSCWIIPERGSWIELNVTKKDQLTVRIDQSGKFSARRSPRLWTRTSDTTRTSSGVLQDQEVKKKKTARPDGAKPSICAAPSRSGTSWSEDRAEVLVPSGDEITEEQAARDRRRRPRRGRGHRRDPDDLLILNSLREDPVKSHEEALLKIYQRLRPGNPPQLEKARELFHEKFFDDQRYRLGRVGRFRLNRKFDQEVPEGADPQARGLRQLGQVPARPARRRGARSTTSTTSATAACGRSASWPARSSARAFLKLRRTAQERMNLENPETVTPADLINAKTFSSAIEYFFGRGELSRSSTRPTRSASSRTSAPLGARPGRPEPQARRLRGARRAHLALRPPLPDRDAGRHEHRPDLERWRSTRRSTTTAS